MALKDSIVFISVTVMRNLHVYNLKASALLYYKGQKWRESDHNKEGINKGDMRKRDNLCGLDVSPLDQIIHMRWKFLS